MERNINDIKLIFKHTPVDYRGTLEKYAVLYGHPERGTILGSIESMPESVYQAKLASATRLEAKAKRDAKLMPIFKQFGIEYILQGSRQFRDTLDDIITFIVPSVKESRRAMFVQELKNAGIRWAE